MADRAVLVSRVGVAILGPELNTPSGVSTHVRHLVRSRLAEQFRLEHFQVGSQGRSEKKIARMMRYLFAPAHLATFLVTRRIHVVHINASMDTKSVLRDIPLIVVCRILGRRVVLQIHGGDRPQEFSRNSLWRRFLLTIGLRLSHAVVVLGEEIKKDYQEFVSGIAPIVIRNGIPLKAGQDVRHTPVRNCVTLFYIGRVAENKGVQDAVEALAILRQDPDLPRLRLVIAGDGPAMAMCEKRASDLELEDSVEFVGPVFGQEKERLWSEADILVFPTFHKEALPYTIIEALAAGVPVISTRAGAIPEMIREPDEAIFVRPNSPSDIAKAIRSLLGDARRLNEMRTACRRRAEELFDVDSMVKRFGEIYFGLV